MLVLIVYVTADVVVTVIRLGGVGTRSDASSRGAQRSFSRFCSLLRLLLVLLLWWQAWSTVDVECLVHAGTREGLTEGARG